MPDAIDLVLVSTPVTSSRLVAAEAGTGPAGEERLRAAARSFEAAFLAEMLRHAGLGKPPGTFNGGAGEAAFSGTLVQEYATQIALAGGVGLADGIFRALVGRGPE